MEVTLVINPGSSSKKYALYSAEGLALSVKFEKTSEGFGKCTEINGQRQDCEKLSAKKYEESLTEILETAKGAGVIKKLSDITKVGVRIVAPGTYFTAHRKIDEGFLKRLAAMVVAAPLHIPPILSEIKSSLKMLPNATHIGVSDSAFHATLPPFARRYSIPEKDAQAHDIHRFGYHGLSVSSVMEKARQFLGRMPRKAIVCHIGSGVSVTAVKDGVSVETSMGFAPASGLVMGSRAGDVDATTLLYLQSVLDLDDEEAQVYINTEGGLKGLFGNADLRVVLDKAEKGDVKAKETVDVYMYRIRHEIGGSIAVLGGLDTLILTGTAPERNPLVRSHLLKDLAGLGIEIDAQKNDECERRDASIEKKGSPVKIIVLRTNEMAEIARVTEAF